MIDPVSISVKAAIDIAIEAIPQIFPLVHDENIRKRLARLDSLLQNVEDGSLSLELIEAKKLHSRIHVHALMTQNATVLAYLEKGILLLGASKSKTVDEQIDLIIFDEDCEVRPRTEKLTASSSPRLSSIKSQASLPEVGRFISFDEQMRLFDTSDSMTKNTAPFEAAVPVTPDVCETIPTCKNTSRSTRRDGKASRSVLKRQYWSSKTDLKSTQPHCWRLILAANFNISHRERET